MTDILSSALAHYHPKKCRIFCEFKLAGSLPAEIAAKLGRERDEQEKHLAGIADDMVRRKEFESTREVYFEKFEQFLDSASEGPRWLFEDRIADIVADAIHYRDGKEYDLLAFTIMPNHVHMVYGTVGRNAIPTYKILQSLKRYTARKANIVLQRTGSFWQDESYDHVIRNGEELRRTIWYVLNNPAKARLVGSWEQWK